MNTDPNIVKNTVKGIVQTCLHVANAQPGYSLADLYNAGTKDCIPDSHEWIFEFIKDGLTPEVIHYCVSTQAAQENYLQIWNSTNAYLSHFGFAEHTVEPIELSV